MRLTARGTKGAAAPCASGESRYPVRVSKATRRSERTAGIKAFRKAAAEFHAYIANRAHTIPNYAERRRYGERVSTAFAESTVNTVVGKRFAKRQQMRWSKSGAHLVLQTRTRVLDGTLTGKFRRWYPGFAARDSKIDGELPIAA